MDYKTLPQEQNCSQKPYPHRNISFILGLFFFLGSSPAICWFNLSIFKENKQPLLELDAFPMFFPIFLDKYIFLMISLLSINRLLTLFFYCPMAFGQYVKLNHMIFTWRNVLGYFEIIIHIKSTFRNVKIIDFNSLLLRCVDTVTSNLLVVIVKGWHIILQNIPRNIWMVIVVIHCPGCEFNRCRFRIVHCRINLIAFSIKDKTYSFMVSIYFSIIWINNSAL